MIYPVILCGGSGTRLWPVSRKSYPKQFSKLIGEKSLFQNSICRLLGDNFANPIIVTNSEFRFIVSEQLIDSGINSSAIIIEPEGKNTAPAVLAAALWLQEKDPDALILVAPSDHVIQNDEKFALAVHAGVDACKQGEFVTFGIHPDRPETGYGYLELTEAANTHEMTPQKLKKFVEKPNSQDAVKMVNSGKYLWNAGIFLFSVGGIIKGFETHAPAMVEPTKFAVSGAKEDLNFLRLASDPWSKLENNSIDYAVMEHADNLSVIPYSGGWSDLGGWDAVWREGEKGENGVVTSGAAASIDCKNTLLRSENKNLEIVGIGLENIIAVAMPDAVLVADMSRSQDVKSVVSLLNEKGVRQAEQFPRDHRPWGWFETLSLGRRFQVKRIVVVPGASLSLQSHVHRSEHWIVVAGAARVTVGDEVKLMTENQSVYIPVGEKHRLENPGKVDLQLIEVQTGAYLGEDDIVRYEDMYKRDLGY